MNDAQNFVNSVLMSSKTSQPRSIIIGTDWWTDCDDVLAMKLFCWAHKQRLIKIEGVAINACMEHSAASVCAYLESEGINDVPISIDAQADDFTGCPPYQKRMAQFSKRIKSNADAENPVKMYRRIIAAAGEPIEIIEIGFPQILAALLESKADEISSLDGTELVRAKVKKLWIMAGKWDEQGGREHNFCNNSRASVAAEKLCRSFPCEMTFLGFEIGFDVISGGCLKEMDNFTANAMLDHGSADGRNSWDPMLAVLAICGDEKSAGYSTVCGTASVNAKDGANYFEENAYGKHKYVNKIMPLSFYSGIIDDILLR